MSHFDYRARTAVDRSERKPGRRNAGNDGRSTGANHFGCGPYRRRRCGGDMGERGGYRGQQVGAASHAPRQ